MIAQYFQALLFPILSILSVGYGIIVHARLWLYRHKWLVTSHLPCPVLSVGNVTVGGTGKTPTTLWIAQQLMNKGLRVGILSRGYRRASRDPFVLVSDGRSLLAHPSEAGDEPFLLAKRCPGLVVAVGADRYRLGVWVLEQEQVDCFVLDDGFQHLSLHRDVDVVLIDSAESQGRQRLLPAGRLREPLNGLKRSTVIMVTRCDNGQHVKKQLCTESVGNDPSEDIITSKFVAESLVGVGVKEKLPTAYLQGMPVLIFSGIANPSSFRRMAESLGVAIVEEINFPDHHPYTPADLEKLVRTGTENHAQALLTTEKDLVKIEETWCFPEPLYAIRIGLQICEGAESLDSCVQTIVSQCRAR